MWCGASTSTWIHETVRHTWRFDFDSSNSVSVVFVIFCLKYVEQKKSLFGLLFLPFRASKPCSTLSCVVFFSLFFFFFPSPGVVCFISRVIWLISESNFAPVLPCTTPLLTDILTFTHFPNLTRCLHTPNKSILHFPHLEHQSEMLPLTAALQTRTVVPRPLGLKEARFFVCVRVCLLAPTCMCGMSADDAGFRLAAASKVSIQALSPFVYLTRFCTLCSLFPPLCLIN